MAKDLTTKQQVFIAEYLVDLNATRAAIAAGYSKAGARVTGSKLLSHPNISVKIGNKVEKRLTKLDITADKVILELGRVAFSDTRKFYNEDGSLKPITDLDDDTAAALAGMDVEQAYENFGKGQAKPTGTIKKIKCWDKVRGLEILARYHKLLTDKVEVSGLDALADWMQKARARVAS